MTTAKPFYCPPPRFMTGQLGTVAYSIPEIWVMGFQQSHSGATILDAIDWWIEQEAMSAEFERQRAVA